MFSFWLIKMHQGRYFPDALRLRSAFGCPGCLSHYNRYSLQRSPARQHRTPGPVSLSPNLYNKPVSQPHHPVSFCPDEPNRSHLGWPVHIDKSMCNRYAGLNQASPNQTLPDEPAISQTHNPTLFYKRILHSVFVLPQVNPPASRNLDKVNNRCTDSYTLSGVLTTTTSECNPGWNRRLHRVRTPSPSSHRFTQNQFQGVDFFLPCLRPWQHTENNKGKITKKTALHAATYGSKNCDAGRLSRMNYWSVNIRRYSLLISEWE